MKCHFFFTLIFFVSAGLCLGQQVQNGSFEDWELIPEINLEEPVDWSSIKTSTGGSIINNAAPKVWDKSTDARTGNYSVELTNKSVFSIVATGAITNGRVSTTMNPADGFMFTDPDDSRWNTPITARPDSLIGWYKQTPAAGDFATVKLLVHKGYAKIPDEDEENWIGFGELEFPSEIVSDWKRFSVPVEYFNDDDPEFVLIILTSGNGYTPVAGSVAWFDDLEFVYNTGGLFNPIATKDYQIYVFNNSIHFQNIPQHVLDASDLELRDITGRLVWSGATQTNSVNPGFQIQPGVYIFRMIYNGEAFAKKIMVR